MQILDFILSIPLAVADDRVQAGHDYDVVRCASKFPGAILKFFVQALALLELMKRGEDHFRDLSGEFFPVSEALA